MGTDAVFFARPEGAPHALGIRPRLAAWLASGHPDGANLRAFLLHAERVLGRRPEGPAGRLALRLDVGLPDDVRLLDHYGLVSYVAPLTEWLGPHGGWGLVSVWATKAVAPDTHLRVGPAEPAPRPSGDRELTVRTTTAAGSPEYTAEVRAQVGDAAPLPPGPVALQLSFRMAPSTDWAHLWQPTVDGLAALLGPAADDRPDDPDDGRVVELGVHRREDPDMGSGVEVTVVARSLPGAGRGPGRGAHG